MQAPPPLDPARSVRARRALRRLHAPRPPTRRDRVTALLNSDPCRTWSGAEFAENLQIVADSEKSSSRWELTAGRGITCGAKR